MFTSATSFTTTPTFNPALFSRICFRVLVFPVPKNPDSIVIGVTLLNSLVSPPRKAMIDCGRLRLHEAAEITE